MNKKSIQITELNSSTTMNNLSFHQKLEERARNLELHHSLTMMMNHQLMQTTRSRDSQKASVSQEQCQHRTEAIDP